MRRLAGMPGQRAVMVFVSPGFILSQLFTEVSGIIDRATRANIVIDTIGRGAACTRRMSGETSQTRRVVRSVSPDPRRCTARQRQFAQSEVLDQFRRRPPVAPTFTNRNDLDEGLRQAVARAPGFRTCLVFAPQNLKLDGSYHTPQSIPDWKTKIRRASQKRILRAAQSAGIRWKPRSRKFKRRFFFAGTK